MSIMSKEEFIRRRRRKKHVMRMINLILIVVSITISVIFITKIVRQNREEPAPDPTPAPTATPTPIPPEYSDVEVIEGNIYVTINNYGNVTAVNVRGESSKQSKFLGQLTPGTSFDVHRMLENEHFYGFYKEDVSAFSGLDDSDGIIWIYTTYVTTEKTGPAETLDTLEYPKLHLEYIKTEKTEVIVEDQAGVFSMPGNPTRTRYGNLTENFVATEVYRSDNYLYYGFLASELPWFNSEYGSTEADPDGIVWIYQEHLRLLAIPD